MAFSGPSVHRCLCFGEGDGPNGAYSPCPPDLCEAETILAKLERAEQELRYTHDRGDHLVYEHEWQAFDRWQRENGAEIAELKLRLAQFERHVEKVIEPELIRRATMLEAACDSYRGDHASDCLCAGCLSYRRAHHPDRVCMICGKGPVSVSVCDRCCE